MAWIVSLQGCWPVADQRVEGPLGEKRIVPRMRGDSYRRPGMIRRYSAKAFRARSATPGP